MTRPKVTLVMNNLTIQGGGQRQFLQLANHLQKRHWDVSVLAQALKRDRCYPKLNRKLSIRTLHHQTKFDSALGGFLNQIRLSLRIAKDNPDLINPHEWPSSWPATIAKLLRLRRPRIVWMCNDLWHQHNPHKKNKPSLSRRVLRKIDVWLIRYLVDEIVVLDHRVQRLVEQIYQRSAVVVRSGLETNKFQSFQPSSEIIQQLRKKHRLSTDTLTLLSVGIFFPQRRHEDVIRALDLIPKAPWEFKYLILGNTQPDPTYFYKIQKLIAQSQYSLSQRLEIIPQSVSEELLLHYYFLADIFIFPNDKQTWGLAPLEATAVGTPSIVSRGAGVHEVLEDGKTAILVEPQHPGKLSTQITRLLQDKPLRQKIGARGRKFVLETFSWPRYTRDMEEVFRRG